MNIKEYISSGVIEAYVLGELSIPEKQEFERNLVLYPILREELRMTEETLEELAFAAAKTPRTALKGKILELALPPNNTRVVPIAHPSAYWKWAAAASVIFGVLAAGLAFNYRQRWAETQGNLENLMAQNQQIAQNYNVVNERLNKIQNDFSVIENTSFKKIVLQGTANAPSALASVYWNESTQEVFLSIQNLKNIAHENQFQLWAIVDGKPVDAGVFDGVAEGLVKMKNIRGAAAFAVTIEPRGGRPTPSLETMQVLGTVDKS